MKRCRRKRSASALPRAHIPRWLHRPISQNRPSARVHDAGAERPQPEQFPEHGREARYHRLVLGLLQRERGADSRGIRGRASRGRVQEINNRRKNRHRSNYRE